MPLFGTLDVEAVGANAPTVESPGNEPWQAEPAEVLTLAYELDDTQREDMIPPSLHPSVPLYGQLSVRRYGSSPVGAFDLAEVRVMGRAGTHYGGYVTGAVASTQDAVDFLRASYAFPAKLGEVALRPNYQGPTATVTVDGAPVLQTALAHPEPISPQDLLFTASFHLGRMSDGLRLLQVETHWDVEQAQRGRPTVKFFESAAFGDDRLKVTQPISAIYVKGKLQVERVRFLIDPTKAAAMGTTKI